MVLKSVVASCNFDHAAIAASDRDAAGHVDNGYADADHADHDCDDFGHANADHADDWKKV